jgi:hypothetical protein
VVRGLTDHHLLGRGLDEGDGGLLAAGGFGTLGAPRERPLTSEGGGPRLARGLLKNCLLLDHNVGAAGGRCGGHGTAIVATVVRRG